jgi:hypothetical protein
MSSNGDILIYDNFKAGKKKYWGTRFSNSFRNKFLRDAGMYENGGISWYISIPLKLENECGR